MACLIKAPDASGKGCVSFTTPERDQVIKKDPAARAAVEALKSRYLIGLHHNWHDHDFIYDPLFDFSMAGEDDLGKNTFPRVGIDACNFAPECFGSAEKAKPFWDVLNVSRAVAFKGIPEFFNAIRTIYDTGRLIRVLYLCPVQRTEDKSDVAHDIRQRYESLFAPAERQLFSLVTMEWDYPFPLDLETLAFFYRSSRVFVHPAPEERRCRTAAYAWADKMPVVARANVGSILAPSFRRSPFLYAFDDAKGMASAILRAIDARRDDPDWAAVAEQFAPRFSAVKLAAFLDGLAGLQGDRMSVLAINTRHFDIRLGRHHMKVPGTNGLPQDLISFCNALSERSESELASLGSSDDPELRIGELAPSNRVSRFFRRLKQ